MQLLNLIFVLEEVNQDYKLEQLVDGILLETKLLLFSKKYYSRDAG